EGARRRRERPSAAAEPRRAARGRRPGRRGAPRPADVPGPGRGVLPGPTGRGAAAVRRRPRLLAPAPGVGRDRVGLPVLRAQRAGAHPPGAGPAGLRLAGLLPEAARAALRPGGRGRPPRRRDDRAGPARQRRPLQHLGEPAAQPLQRRGAGGRPHPRHRHLRPDQPAVVAAVGGAVLAAAAALPAAARAGPAAGRVARRRAAGAVRPRRRHVDAVAVLPADVRPRRPDGPELADARGARSALDRRPPLELAAGARGGGAAHHRAVEPDRAGRRPPARGPAVLPGPAGRLAARRRSGLLPRRARPVRDGVPAVGGAGLVQPVPGARADPAGGAVLHRAGVTLAGDRPRGAGRRGRGGAVRAAGRVPVPPAGPARRPRRAGARPGPPGGL
ncbi:MAG: hypothetical protein AVDCRST_MAG48-1099, partial [uncultured Friedmanniella sp.]